MTLLENAMMRPPGATCSAAWPSTRKVPRRLVAMIRSKASSVPAAIGPSGMMPAPFTTTSSRPKARRVSWKSRSTSAASATSALTAKAWPPAALISATADSAGAALPA